MSHADSYIHLQSLTMKPGNMTDEAGAEARRTWLCGGCGRPKPGVTRLDAHLRNPGLQGPLNLVFGFGVPLARLSFLLMLGEERVNRDLYLGNVFGPDGRRWDDWVTFRGKCGLIVRGTKHAANRVCSQCGRNCYFAMHPRYLFPQPSTDVELFESVLFGLIIPEHVANEVGIGGGEIRRVRAERIDWPGVSVVGHRRHLLVERLRVLPEPKDALPPLSF